MIINDHDKYFKKSWKKHWQAADSDRSVFEHYKIPVSAIFKKYKIAEI